MAEKDKSKQLPAPAQKQELATAKKQPTVAEKVEQELQNITSANFYPVPGRAGGADRMVPDSRALQHYANKFPGGIATKIVDAGVNEGQAWAHIQAWPCNDPARISEDKVTIVFAFEFQGYLWDYVIKGCKNHKSGCPLVRENGKAVLKEGVPQLEDIGCIFQLRQLMNRKMRFAEREAITKCKSRLYLQIMNMEWRDPEEIENEDKDISLIAGKDVKPVSVTTTAAATASTADAIANAKQPEPKKEAPKQPAAQPPAKTNGKETAEPYRNPAVPKAQIPTTPFPPMPGSKEAIEAERKAAVEAPQPATIGQPKKRSERLSDLANLMSCSGQNVLSFIAASLNCADPNDLATKPKTDIDAIIVSLEACTQKFNPSTVGVFIKKEPMSETVSKEIADFFLSVFSVEMKKSEVPANG